MNWLRERLHRLLYERIPRWSGKKILIFWFYGGVLELLTYQVGRFIEEMADVGRLSCPDSALGPCPGDVSFIGRWLLIGLDDFGVFQEATLLERLGAWLVMAAFFLIPTAVVVITWRWLSSAPSSVDGGGN